MGTSRFVAAIDVSVIVGACICGAITGMLGQKCIQKINSNLSRVSVSVQRKYRQHNFKKIANMIPD